MKILLTGATGYIGKLLKNKLLEDKDVTLRLYVRDVKKIRDVGHPQIEVVEGDTFDREALKKAVQGVDTAYYLIHSMGEKGDFKVLDRISAENFRDACIDAGVKRIIYLGGLGTKETASEHLLSRLETGEVLSGRPDSIQTIWFRAAVIIGAGSASFIILRSLVQKLPVMTTPKWVSTRTQPIAVSDVIRYLTKAKCLKVDDNLVVDIGSEQMSFKEMLHKTAKAMGLMRFIVPVPVLTPRLSSYWVILFSPVPFPVASALIEGLRSETVIQNDNAKRFFPDISPVPFDEAVRRAIAEKP
ncbi:MAG TPA: NAD(P)H-binding protein [Thermodesulfovibrionia bacterium]|nr:NAD(P)H-binding protein [Thermodesulfovibrionia bacterium]